MTEISGRYPTNSTGIEDAAEPLTLKEVKETVAIGGVAMVLLGVTWWTLDNTVFEDSAPEDRPAPVIAEFDPDYYLR